MILDYFEGAFYLNLDKRTERKEAFEISCTRRTKETPGQTEGEGAEAAKSQVRGAANPATKG
jgi:hypothetical protein